MKRARAKSECKESHFLTLPCEVWQCVIWPQCGKGQGLGWATVCRAWQRMACDAIRHFTPRTLPYSKRLYDSLVKSYLMQFTSLTSFYLDKHWMRVTSVMGALVSLPKLRTLCIGSFTDVAARQLTALKQLTALDLQYTTGVEMPSMTQLALLNAPCMYSTSIIQQLPALTNLSFLNIDHAKRALPDAALTPLISLQYLSAARNSFESFGFLAALTSLTLLDLDQSRATQHEPYSPPLLGLTKLNFLSIDAVAVPIDTVLALTQLRVLGIGEYADQGHIGLERLDEPLLVRLRHLRLFYAGFYLRGAKPSRVTELGLKCGGDRERADVLRHFNQWHRPLPPHYFNGSEKAMSPFIKTNKYI